MATKKLARPHLKNLDDLFGLDGTETQGKPSIQEIPLDKFRPFAGHPFNIYEGERLEDMVESIKANGVLMPVTARKIDGDVPFEILAGHNRINAARIAGLETVPAVILEDISDETAMVYVVETNLIQRSFADMSHSEKGAVIAMHHSRMFSQGKRNDILEQLKALESPESETVKVQKVKFLSDTDESAVQPESESGKRTTEKIGALYSLARNTVARYLRIDQLVKPLKPMVDNGKIPFIAAVELSFLATREQHQLAEFLQEGYSVNGSKAEILRKFAKEGTLTADTMTDILSGHAAAEAIKPRKIKVSGELYTRYFKPEQSAKEVESIIADALEKYFNEG